MIGQLRRHATLQHRFDQARQIPVLARQLQLARINPGHQVFQQTSIDQLVHRRLLDRSFLFCPVIVMSLLHSFRRSHTNRLARPCHLHVKESQSRPKQPTR